MPIPSMKLAFLTNGEKYTCYQWKPGEKNTLFALNSEMKIRGSSLRKKPSEEIINYIFGVEQSDGVRTSRDPMVEFLCIPGNPRHLSKECGLKSKELGVVSAICIFCGLIMNFTLVFLFLLLLTNKL